MKLSEKRQRDQAGKKIPKRLRRPVKVSDLERTMRKPTAPGTIRFEDKETKRARKYKVDPLEEYQREVYEMQYDDDDFDYDEDYDYMGIDDYNTHQEDQYWIDYYLDEYDDEDEYSSAEMADRLDHEAFIDNETLPAESILEEMRWLTNIYDPTRPDAYINFTNYVAQWETKEQGWARLHVFLKDKWLGMPKATEKYTVAELMSMRMVGVYDFPKPGDQNASTDNQTNSRDVDGSQNPS